MAGDGFQHGKGTVFIPLGGKDAVPCLCYPLLQGFPSLKPYTFGILHISQQIFQRAAARKLKSNLRQGAADFDERLHPLLMGKPTEVQHIIFLVHPFRFWLSLRHKIMKDHITLFQFRIAVQLGADKGAGIDGQVNMAVCIQPVIDPALQRAQRTAEPGLMDTPASDTVPIAVRHTFLTVFMGNRIIHHMIWTGQLDIMGC